MSMANERNSKSYRPKVVGPTLLGLLIFIPATIIVIVWPSDTLFGIPPLYILVVGVILYFAQIVRELLKWRRSR
jgi:hypothetical protein